MRTSKKLFANCPWEVESKAIGNYRPQEEVMTGKVDLNESSMGFIASGAEREIFKAFIPWFLYKPPYGFPRENNPLQLRQFAKNPYIFAVKKTLMDEVASVPYDIVLREEYINQGKEEDNETKKQIIRFFDNPNGNDESFEYLLRAWVGDVIDIGEFIGVKVFDGAGRFCQLFARDSGTFLKNPDIYGYMGNRNDFVPPVTQYILTGGMPANFAEQYQKVKTPQDADHLHESMRSESYDAMYRDSAAYFQYGWTAGARPVPFGKREILTGGLTPKTNSIYHQSPIEILYNQILTLIYGAEYNLDFYLNNNLPNGILTIKGATPDQATTYRQQMENTFMGSDEFGNFKKKHFKIPITGYEAAFTQMQMSSKEMEVIEQQKWFAKLVWSVFGVTAAEMGFTEDSNRATDQNQSEVSKRKAVKPFLKMFEYAINTQLMPEFGHPEYEFKFIEYDLDEEKKKHDLWEQQIRMGIRTPRQVAVEELGISEEDFDSAQMQKAEKEASENEMMNPQEEENDWWTKSEVKSSSLEIKLKKALKELKQKILNDLEIQYQSRGLPEIKGYIDIKAITTDSLEKYNQFFTEKGYESEIKEFITKEFLKGVEQIEKKIGRNIIVQTSNVNELQDYIYKNIKGLNEELINKLQGEISRAILNRESFNQIKERVSEMFNLSENRAITIVRTESVRALNLGNYDAAKESGIKFNKYLSVREDERTSKECGYLNKEYGTPEQAIGIDEPFKLEDGTTQLLPPFHVNCRTRALFIEEKVK